MGGEEEILKDVVFATGLLVYLYVGARVFWYLFLRSIDLHFVIRDWMKGWIKKLKGDIDKRMKG